MLSNRQRQVIKYLQNDSYTGKELAGFLQVSQRTVIRDIARINDFLSIAAVGYIESDPNYHLVIQDRQGLQSILSSVLTDENRVLVTLVTTANLTLDTLADTTWLSPAAVRRIIEALNLRYQGVLFIDLVVGQGIVVEFNNILPVDFLAGLASQNLAVAYELEKMSLHTNPILGLMDAEIVEYEDKVCKWITHRQANLQEMSAVACAPLCYRSKSNQLQASKASLMDVFAQKILLMNRITSYHDDIIFNMRKLMKNNSVPISDELLEAMYVHAVRCSLFPTYMTYELSSQMAELRLKHPFEFDFATDLTHYLYSLDKAFKVESDFLALYVIAALQQITDKGYSVLVLGGKKSITHLNRLMLEQALETAQIELVYDVEEAKELLSKNEYSLKICFSRSGLQQIEDWDLYCSGMLGANDIKKIERLTQFADYKRDFAKLLPEGAFITCEVDTDDTYLDVLDRGLCGLVDKGVITQIEADGLYERELQGERLHFANIAFPHGLTKTPSNTFRLFAIAPSKPIYDQSLQVNIMIGVLASTKQTDFNSIFSYLLEHTQKSGDLQFPEQGWSHSKIIDALVKD